MKAETLAAALDIPLPRASAWAGPLTDAFSRYDISTPLRQAAFLSQVGHESGGLSKLEENLNYSAGAMVATWPKHFTLEEATAYVHQPQRIANRAYANRMGNGDEASGDGWRFRGRGLMELTGKDAYIAAGVALGLSLVINPDLLLVPANAAMSAGWEWSKGALNAAADLGDIDTVSDIINIGHKTAKYGDSIGFADRKVLYDRARAALGV